MRRWLAATALMMVAWGGVFATHLWSEAAWAQAAAPAPPAAVPEPTVTAAEGAAIQDVIRGQMEAFRRDDAAAAFGFASPGIQAQFGRDADVFMQMVRRGYQPVYRPRSTSFGRLDREGGQVVQHVLVVGPDGGGREALYFMEREADGTWRIAGCELTESSDVGT